LSKDEIKVNTKEDYPAETLAFEEKNSGKIYDASLESALHLG
jgi:hypothetical protein